MLMHVSPNANSFEKPERITKTIEVLSELDIIDRLVKIDVSFYLYIVEYLE